ncbi:MAG: carboxypeptidase-like regulatory domain-containing protein [Bacteroidota bacterium]
MRDSSKYSYVERHPRNGIAFLLAAYFLLQFFLPVRGFANGEPDPVLPFDEILVFMNVQGVGNVQIPAAIRNESAYLSITDVFDYLKIRNITSPGMDSVSGFFITQQAVFLIDKKNNRIEYQGKKIDLPPDAFIHTGTTLYLRTDYFGQIFGLQCKFNFRSLSVILSTNLELPIMREMRQEAMRNNLGKLKGELRADTAILRSYPLFKFGMADWAAIHTQDIQQKTTDTRLNLSLGGVVAGGETNISLNYHNTMPFDERQQYYQWRFVDDDNTALRQVTAGKIFMPSVSSIYSPVVGVQFTNAPAVYRRSFGTYTLTYYTEAGWIAELYVNNTLVDYSKADVTGLANFQVPLVYGSSLVKIRFYSPWGEERTSEQNIQIPFNFLPLHEFQYVASAGIVEDTLHSKFGRIDANYGLSKHLTVGTGMEYLSSVTSGKAMPFVNASLRLSSNLLFSGEYTYGVRTKFVGSYHLPSDLQIEANYTRYKQGQTAINNTFLEERKVIVSFPFRRKRFTMFSKLSVYEIVLPNFKYAGTSKYTTVEGLLSGVVFGVNTNLTTYGLLTDQSSPYIYSNLSMAFRLPGKIIFTPQLQYEYSHLKIIDIRGEVGKYINSRGYLNVYYENNYKSAFQSIGIGLRYDFSFAITGLSFTRGNHGSGNMVQSASGSMMYDGQTNRAMLNNRNSVGKGAITILPYLDINGNGQRDQNEPAVSGVGVSVNGGRTRYNKADKSVQVTDLEAYASYTVKLSESFENIAWHIRNKTISVAIDPNQFKVIEVPVAVVNEVAGIVFVKDGDGKRPLSRIIISFYRVDLSLAGEIVTEPDGSFNFTGLAPGVYTAQINSAQLEKLHMKALPWSLPIRIKTTKDGDFVDGLNFVLQPR